MEQFDSYLSAMKNSDSDVDTNSRYPERSRGGEVIQGNFYQHAVLRRHRRVAHKKSPGHEPVIVLWDEIESQHHEHY